MNTFDFAVDLILSHEGGYNEIPGDAGGPTNRGVSLRAILALDPDKRAMWDLDHDGDVDSADIRLISEADAKKFYREEYWNPVRGDLLPPQVAVCVFDSAVNQGVLRATLTLQEQLGVVADGIIGTKTILASHRVGEDFVDRFQTARVEFYVDLAIKKPSQLQFRRGWLRRCFATARAVLGLPA